MQEPRLSEFPPPEWKPSALFKETAQKLRSFREGEKRGGAIENRTAFVVKLFSPHESGGPSFVERYRAEGAPFSLWADADGLRLDLGFDDADGIHSHIPYTFVSDELISRIEHANLLSTGTAGCADLAIRAAEARGETVISEVSLEDILLDAEYVERVVRGDVFIPAPAIRSYLEGEPSGERVMALLSLASRLNAGESEPPSSYMSARSLRSGEQTRFTKSAYTVRAASLYTDPRNAEAAKILTELFKRYDEKALAAMGIGTVRGKYAAGREFLALYGTHQYERVLIDPKKHLRDGAYERYAALPAVENSDFEAFEGFMLPYLNLRALTEGEVMDPTRLLEVVSELSSELSPEDYEPFLKAAKEYVRGLQRGEGDTDAFKGHAKELLSRYGARFESRSVQEILDTYLKRPERTEISYDASFIEGAPEDLRPKIESYLSSLPIRAPKTTVMRSGTEHGVPFALEGRALRALKIEARPTIVLVTGAKFEDVRSEESIETLAASIISVGRKTGANIFMQGTQSGRIAETVVRAYLQYLKDLPEGEEPVFRLIGIEPGRSVYAGPLGYPNAELQGPSPLLPIDTILSPYAAGWSPGETIHTYLPHVIFRQSIIRHAASDHAKVTLVVNGGGWSIPECVESGKDGFAHVVVPESGRLALMLAHLEKTRAKWVREGVEGGLGELAGLIELQPEAERARLIDDLVLMQERGLQELIEQIMEGLPVQSVEAKDIERALLAVLDRPE